MGKEQGPELTRRQFLRDFAIGSLMLLATGAIALGTCSKDVRKGLGLEREQGRPAIPKREPKGRK